MLSDSIVSLRPSTPRCHRSDTRRQGGRPTCSKARAYKSPSAGPRGLVGSAREASNPASCSVREPGSPEISGPPEADGGGVERAEAIGDGRRPGLQRISLGIRRLRTLRGRRGRHAGTEQIVKARNHWRVAEALPHSEGVAYNQPCWEVATCLPVGRMGPTSVEGPGQNNPDRSEGPWGRAAWTARIAVLDRAGVPDTEREGHVATKGTKAGGKLTDAKGTPGAGLTGVSEGKAPADKLALKPYWGKPAVRNFRGGGGNVGIIEARYAPPPYPTILQPDSQRTLDFGSRKPSMVMLSGTERWEIGRRNEGMPQGVPP